MATVRLIWAALGTCISSVFVFFLIPSELKGEFLPTFFFALDSALPREGLKTLRTRVAQYVLKLSKQILLKPSARNNKSHKKRLSPSNESPAHFVDSMWVNPSLEKLNNNNVSQISFLMETFALRVKFNLLLLSTLPFKKAQLTFHYCVIRKTTLRGFPRITSYRVFVLLDRDTFRVTHCSSIFVNENLHWVLQ